MTVIGTKVDGAGKHAIGNREAHATRAIFFVSGFGAASWAPLVPVLRERLAIGDDLLGVLLLCIGIGSLLVMPVAGVLAERIGCRRVLIVSAVLYAASLLSICFVNSFWMAVPVIFFFGGLMGCMDVVMNIAAVIVEQGGFGSLSAVPIGRRIMEAAFRLDRVPQNVGSK